MRIEKGYCAMGHELDGDVTPLEIGLDPVLRQDGGFIGADALAAKRAEGVSPRIVSLTLDDETAVPLGHEPIYLNDRIIGKTTSCAFGFRVGKPVAIGFCKEAVADGTRVEVDIARTRFSATVTIGALFDPEGERMKG